MPKDKRPPKAWWDRCVNANQGRVTDTGRYCGWLYHNVVVKRGAALQFTNVEQASLVKEYESLPQYEMTLSKVYGEHHTKTSLNADNP